MSDAPHSGDGNDPKASPPMEISNSAIDAVVESLLSEAPAPSDARASHGRGERAAPVLTSDIPASAEQIENVERAFASTMWAEAVVPELFVDAALSFVFGAGDEARLNEAEKDIAAQAAPDHTADTIQDGMLVEHFEAMLAEAVKNPTDTDEMFEAVLDDAFADDSDSMLNVSSDDAAEPPSATRPAAPPGGVPRKATPMRTAAGVYLPIRRLGVSRHRESVLVAQITDDGVSRTRVLERLVGVRSGSWNLAMLKFFAEAKVAASVEHPNITQTVEYGSVDGVPFRVREFVNGVSLASLSSMLDQPLPAKVVATIARSVAAGLQGLHTWSNPTVPEANLAHGSLTPTAVVIGFDGVVRIAQLRLGQIAGTSSRIARRPDDPYAAPEVRSGVGLDARTDLHALGLLIAELLTARSPPSNDPDDLRNHPHARRTPAALITLTAQLLNRSPAGRPQSAAEVLEQLDAILDRVGGPVDLAEALAQYFVHVRPVVDLPGVTPRQVPAPPEEQHMIYVPRSKLLVPALVFLLACLAFGFLFAMYLAR